MQWKKLGAALGPTGIYMRPEQIMKGILRRTRPEAATDSQQILSTLASGPDVLMQGNPGQAVHQLQPDSSQAGKRGLTRMQPQQLSILQILWKNQSSTRLSNQAHNGRVHSSIMSSSMCPSTVSICRSLLLHIHAIQNMEPMLVWQKSFRMSGRLLRGCVAIAVAIAMAPPAAGLMLLARPGSNAVNKSFSSGAVSHGCWVPNSWSRKPPQTLSSVAAYANLPSPSAALSGQLSV